MLKALASAPCSAVLRLIASAYAFAALVLADRLVLKISDDQSLPLILISAALIVIEPDEKSGTVALCETNSATPLPDPPKPRDVESVLINPTAYRSAVSPPRDYFK